MAVGPESRCAYRQILGSALAIALIALAGPLRGQVVSDNFDSGGPDTASGWTPYEGSPGTREVRYEHDPAGGYHYRLINHAPKDESGIFSRGGSIRNDATYTSSFFLAADVNAWDDKAMIGLAGTFLMAKAQTPGSLTTFGYLTAYLSGGPRAPQGLLGFIEFQSELQATYPDEYTGGFVLTTKLDSSKGYRYVFKSGPGTLGGLLIAEMYDLNDLLEPIARGVARDDLNNASHPQGASGIGNLNVGARDTVDWTGTADTTFDNFYASPNSNNFVGFVGTAQVANLVPGPQTLFYPIPASHPITFNATTFNVNQIDTNNVKLFLNGTDVSSQLTFTEVRDVLLGSPSTNFLVQYNGPLSGNTIYNGKIIVLDKSGKGTTNTWVFDTFTTSGIITVEAEDYNYNSGQFQDNPAVSGLDPDGNQVNPGLGYYNQTGTEEVDYHDNHHDSINITERNQYRNSDFAGTVQARMERTYGVRSQYAVTNVGEYFVTGLGAGEWMNYTRTFPSNNYYVYLRASAQKAQAVRLDEVTSDRSQSNQTTVLRGQFLVPNTLSSSRFRYVPLTDAAGNIQTVNLSGVKTHRLTVLEASQKNTIGAGDIQLNYLLYVPAPAPGTQRAFVGYASPAGGTAMFDPQGTVQIHIINRDTAVSLSSVQLSFDGVNVTSSATIVAANVDGLPGATISYRPPGFLLPNSPHSLSVAYSDGSVTQTNQWTFTIQDMPTLFASDISATGPDSAFTVQSHKGQNSDPTAHTVGSFNNNISRAERQLGGTLGDADTPGMTFVNEGDTNGGFAALTFTEPTAIHYEQCGGSTPLFGAASTYPGIPTAFTDPNNTANDYDCSSGSTSPDHFAMSATINLSLAAGVYRMGFDADDGVIVQAGQPGTNYQGFALNTILGSSETIPGERQDDATGKAQFDFVVQTNGVYTFRLVQEEGTGGAYVDWFWVNRTTGARELVRPLALESATSIKGPFATETGAAIDPGNKVITLPKSGATRFYRLRSSAGYTLNRPIISGGNVILTYQ